MDALGQDVWDTPRNWRTWIIIVLLALLAHLLLFLFRFSWVSPTHPPRVDIHEINQKKLEEIRKQWKKWNQPKQLLLDKNKSLPSAKEAPKDARYMSDKNIRVEKEQRAKQTNVIPRPNIAPSHPKAAPIRPQTHSLPKLGDLGVPFKLTPQNQRPNSSSEPDPRIAQQGGDQSLLDKNLPEGSENLLNAQESVYYSFYARLYEAVGQIWQAQIAEIPYQRQILSGDYTTNVDVVLDRDGNLIAVNLIQGSGVTEFDNAVSTSWHKIDHFPNPPKGLLDAQGQVHTGWSFTVEIGQGLMNLVPPSRTY